jgi:ammonium transporter, Amt family
MNAANTAFVLVSAALVMFMTPGLALFYGGMVRGKNILGTLMQNFILIALIGVQWALIGYSLAFGPSLNGIVGSLDYLGLAGVGMEPFKAYSETIPHGAFMIFQMMFAIITPALITGAWAERMKFSSFLVFGPVLGHLGV